MKQFISCDWGTSTFRLRLVESSTQKILSEIATNQGISARYALWKNSSEERFNFYRVVLSEGIEKLEEQYGLHLFDIPIIISGMASSTIGMLELDYRTCPFKTDGDLLVHITDATDDFRHRIIIISGVRSLHDIMRGEETMITGCNIAENNEEQLFILPGTHSKHVFIKNGFIRDFKTYMTGEVFDLLCTKSILSASVEPGNSLTENINSSFEKGVKEGGFNNILHSIFHVRTNKIFDTTSPKENYHYLSGLLIGGELKDLLHKNYDSITVVSDEKFLQLYSNALNILGINKNIRHINADIALTKGQSVIYKLYQ